MFVTVDEAKKLINQGKLLHIAGHANLLEQLPKGNWIGGSTILFMTAEGCTSSREKLHVTEFDFATDFKIKVYDKDTIFDMLSDDYPNGLNVLIMPKETPLVTYYAKESQLREELLFHPTVGWIAGKENSEPAECSRVFDGSTGESYTDKGVVMFLELPEGKTAFINIVNIFEIDEESPVITFQTEGNIVENCCVDGKEVNLAEYIRENNIDTRLPLISDCNGVYLNSGINYIDCDKTVFYVPVQTGFEYRVAKPVKDYVGKFAEKIREAGSVAPVFSCNCLLNYMYGHLKGEKIPPYEGPVTFGEIGYRMFGQTLVYCEIIG